MHPRIAPNSVRSVDICIALSDTFYVVLVRGQLHAPFDLPRFNRISICSYFLNYFRENLFCCIFICFYFRLQKISYEPHSIKRHGENGSSRRASLLPRTVRLPHRSHCVPLDINRYGFGSFWHAVRDSNPRPSGPQVVPKKKRSHFGSVLRCLTLFGGQIFRCFRPELPLPIPFWVKSGSKFPRRRLRGRSRNNGCKHNTHSKDDSESAANRLFHVILLKYNVYCFLRRQVNTVPRFVQP